MHCNKFYFWMQYLKIEKLNLATAAISLIYIVIPLLSALILKEKFKFQNVFRIYLNCWWNSIDTNGQNLISMNYSFENYWKNIYQKRTKNNYEINQFNLKKQLIGTRNI